MSDNADVLSAQRMPAIDIARLKSLLDGVNAFGRNPETGGMNRAGYSDADMAARTWLADRMRDAGLAVSVDGAVNVTGRFGPATGPCIMAGSHLDTVPEGGAFDGALGVCAALECVLAMRDAGIAPHTAIEIVATAEEEGRFGGMLGSQALTGQVTRRWIENAVDADGLRLTDVMAAQGLNAFDALDCARAPGSVASFLELHVEQGPVLETTGVPVGIVDTISGVSNLAMTLSGHANHSGTTPMDMRADAFAGLADFAAAIPDIIADLGTQNSRITIGKVDLEPNFPHTIPGRAEFSVITRDADEDVLHRLIAVLKDRAGESAERHALSLAVDERSWLPPVRLDPHLASMLADSAERHGIQHTVMPSGAGHDAQTMQSLCPSALLFVPSRGGISHAPEEFTAWDDIERGTTVLLDTLAALSLRRQG